MHNACCRRPAFRASDPPSQPWPPRPRASGSDDLAGRYKLSEGKHGTVVDPTGAVIKSACCGIARDPRLPKPGILWIVVAPIEAESLRLTSIWVP